MAEDVYAKFQDLVGESMDEDHLGEKGWIQIKSFSFGFGFKGTDGTIGGKGGKSKAKTLEEYKKEREEEKKAEEQKKKKRETWGHSGALDFEKVSLSKNADSMSKRLTEICHTGACIPEVLIVMCRPGGTHKDKKTEFLCLTFKEVYVRSCTLSLAVEGLPSEDIQLEYNSIRMKSVWTDNAIGNRRPEQPIGAGWDLKKQEQIGRDE